MKTNIEEATKILESYGNKIVAATKYVDSEEILKLYNIGYRDFGENRVDSFLEKHEKLDKYKDINWHFIGTLQSKKVKHVINKIDFVHSIDRLKLIDEIQKHATSKKNVFIQLNISNEDSKHGISNQELDQLLQNTQKYDKINIVGLMGMAPLSDNVDLIDKAFKQLSDKLNHLNSTYNLDMKFLSMGMSNDYKIALKHGATHLRLGSILYKER